MSVGLRWMVRAIAALLVALCVKAGVAGEIPPGGQGIDAVATVFAHTYRHLITGSSAIQINSTAQPPWGEARIVTRDVVLYIQARGDAECHYDLSHMVARQEDGHRVVSEERIASIAFGLLSDEMETRSWRTSTFPDDVDYIVTVFGMPGAVCEVSGALSRSQPSRNASGKDVCFDRLVQGEYDPKKYREFLRALRYVFSHVCSPAELPLGR